MLRGSVYWRRRGNDSEDPYQEYERAYSVDDASGREAAFDSIRGELESLEQLLRDAYPDLDDDEYAAMTYGGINEDQP